MKTFLIIAGLAGLAYLGIMTLVSGALPHMRLRNVIELPGAAISRIDLTGGDPAVLLLVVGAAVVVLIVGFVALAK
jgi:hypothetical protein